MSVLDGEGDTEVKEKEPEEYEVERVVDYQFCKLEVSVNVCVRRIVADPDLSDPAYNVVEPPLF